MYSPLKFVEQMESYLRIPNSRSMESIVNAKSMKFADEFLDSSRHELFHDFGIIRDSIVDDKPKVFNKYSNKHSNFCKLIGIEGVQATEDFIDMLIYYDARRIWRKNKLVYLIDDKFFDTLCNMNLPKLAPVDCMTKLPANCFYIDYNGRGDEICKDLNGTFILTDESDTELVIILLHLVGSKILNRELLISTCYRLPLNGTDKFIPSSGIGRTSTIECEDGVVRVVDEDKLCQFIFNFLIYLHAANRDVEISERTRQNHEKVQKNIRNKFREVKEFEVGFIYGKSISKDAKRVKYIGKAEENGVAHSPKSSHYRSAHWHHYWVGSGEDKKLIIKWVEGVFVNGGKEEAENIQIHKVK